MRLLRSSIAAERSRWRFFDWAAARLMRFPGLLWPAMLSARRPQSSASRRVTASGLFPPRGAGVGCARPHPHLEERDPQP